MSHIQNKPELLSPAGNLECFFAAVENGADAVYLGLKDFSARAGADNFSLEDISRVIAYAHKKSISVYIAFNTLIKTNELEKTVDYLIALEELQPNALIIQDLGLLYLLQQKFPHFKLHASTQMTIHNLAGAKQAGEIGFKRVVLSRELSIEEISNICRNTSVEIEVFIHGALCYSYSGLCLFSSMIGGRSGNRGRCAQPCRMYYKSKQNQGGYLFSMKDLLTLPHLEKLAAVGVHAFKIEGRMKSPEYVAVVTNAYRQAIDGKLEDMDDAIHVMNTVFSRETTYAYLFDKGYQPDIERLSGDARIKPADMVNPSYPANIGSYAGEVIKSNKGCITIRADAEIGVRDLLQVFENSAEEPSLLHVKHIKVDGKRVFDIKAGDIAAVNSERQYRQGARLYLLSSRKIKEQFTPKIPKKLQTSRIPVNAEVKIGSDGISIQGAAGCVTFKKDYHIKLEKGINRTIEESSVKECFSRLGDTPFELAGIHTNILGDLFIPLSVLNEIRRNYFQHLAEVLQWYKAHRGEEIKKWLEERITAFTNSTHGNSGWQLANKWWHEQPPLCSPNKRAQRGSSVANMSDKLSARDVSDDGIRLSLKVDKLHYLNHLPLEKISKIYIVLTGETIKNFVVQQDINQIPINRGELRGLLNICIENNEGISPSEVRDKIVFSLPAIMRDRGNGHETYGYFKKVVQELIAQGFRQFQISNPGAMELFDDGDVQLYADYPLYCLNPLSATKLREWGFCRHTLSPEDDKENVQTLFSRNADVIVHQDTPLFTSETCIWANMKNACPGRNRCGFKQIMLENEYGDRFLALNEACKTIVINEKPFSVVHLIPGLVESGQNDFRIDLCYKDYTPELIADIFSVVHNKGKVKSSMIGNFERGLG